MRTTCECGCALPKNVPGNWGEWRCDKCNTAYCQDCGAVMWFNTCSAYEEEKEQEERENG